MYTYPEGDCGGDGELYNVSGISDGGTNYKLDDDHLEQYGLEGIRNDC